MSLTTPTLGLGLSPYFLATREAPAMAALMLGSSVATLLPRPRSGESRESVRRAVDQAPKFLRLLDSWSWSGPLWRIGAVKPGVGEARCEAELEAVYAKIEDDPSLLPLRRIVRHAEAARRKERLVSDEADSASNGYLELLCADLLKGGGDPAVSVPVVNALDRFCAEHGLISVRGDTESVMHRIESALARKAFTFGVPVLSLASGSIVARMRAELSAELETLRAGIAVAFEIRAESAADAQIEGVGARAADRDRERQASLRRAALAFGGAFEAWSKSVVGRDDEFGERVAAGYISVTGVVLPVDAAIRSGRAAAKLSSGLAASAGVVVGTGTADAGCHVRAAKAVAEPTAANLDSSSRVVRSLIVRQSRIRPVEAGREQTNQAGA